MPIVGYTVWPSGRLHVRSGTVHIEGEDGARWSYTYADGQVTQQGWSGWDGSVEPFGKYVETPHPDLG